MRLTTIVLLALLTACSTPEVVTSRYYLLNTASAVSTLPAAEHEGIALAPIQLADYLDQPHLPVQLSDNQLQFSRTHMWAEPLRTGMAKVLVSELNQAAGAKRFLLSDDASTHSHSLHLRVNHFHASEQGRLVLAGQFGWKPANSNTAIAMHDFHFSDTLSAGGFAETVERMRELLKPLARQILASPMSFETRTGQE